MKSISVFLLSVCLSLNCCGDEATRNETKTTWVSVHMPPGAGKKTRSYEICLESGTDLKLVSAVANAVRSASKTDPVVRIEPRLALAFKSDRFLLLRIGSGGATFAFTDQFPVHVTESLAESLENRGIGSAKVVAVDDLVVRELANDPFARVYTKRDTNKNIGKQQTE